MIRAPGRGNGGEPQGYTVSEEAEKDRWSPEEWAIVSHAAFLMGSTRKGETKADDYIVAATTDADAIGEYRQAYLPASDDPRFDRLARMPTTWKMFKPNAERGEIIGKQCAMLSSAFRVLQARSQQEWAA